MMIASPSTGPVRILSTDTDSGSVTVIERDGRAFRVLGSISVGNAPRGAVKVTSDGRGFVCNCGGDTVSEIDVFANREVARIKVGPAPRGIGLVPGDSFALVSSSGDNFVSVVDLDRREEVGRVAVGRDPRHMAVSKDGLSAYVCIWGGHYISHLDISGLAAKSPDPASVREVTQIDIGEEAHPYSLAIEPAGRRAFVANTQAPFVSVVDLGEDRVVAAVEIGSKGGRAIAFAADGERAFVTVEDTSEVVAIDTKAMSVLSRWPVGPGPRGIAMDPGGGFMYTSAFARTTSRSVGERVFGANTLTVIDLDAIGHELRAEAFDEVDVGKGPCSVSAFALDRLARRHFGAQAGGRAKPA
jgi:DNA-binding beta-propeller fold protein YncE